MEDKILEYIKQIVESNHIDIHIYYHNKIDHFENKPYYICGLNDKDMSIVLGYCENKYKNLTDILINGEIDISFKGESICNIKAETDINYIHDEFNIEKWYGNNKMKFAIKTYKNVFKFNVKGNYFNISKEDYEYFMKKYEIYKKVLDKNKIDAMYNSFENILKEINY